MIICPLQNDGKKSGNDWDQIRPTINQKFGENPQIYSQFDMKGHNGIDLKADESGLLQVIRENRWPCLFYPAAALAAVDVPNPSEIVRKYTGTPSVSEAAALLAANAEPSHLIIEKHKLRGPDGRNATVSIARMPL